MKPLIGGFYQPKNPWQASATNSPANKPVVVPTKQASTPTADAAIRDDSFTTTTVAVAPSTTIRSGSSSSTKARASVAPANENAPTISTQWYAPHIASTSIVANLNPNDEASFMDWRMGEWGNSVLKHLDLRPRHQAGHPDLPKYTIPNLEDPFSGLINGVKTKNPDGSDSFKLPMPLQEHQFGPWKFPLPVAWKDKLLWASLLVNAQAESVLDFNTFLKVALPLWQESQIDLADGKIKPETQKNGAIGRLYTQEDKDKALQACIRVIGQNSVGMAKFMQIISNNASAKESMPEATHKALSAFQSDLPPSWKPEEVVKLVEEQFKKGDYLKIVAKRLTDETLKEKLLTQGKVVIELLKNAKGEIEPLGVASTAEVYKCAVRVISKTTGQELLSQKELLGDDTGRIIKVLKKNLVKPVWWDKHRTPWKPWEKPIDVEELPKKQLARDRQLLKKLFTLISDDQRVLDYWLGKVDTLCDSWEPELDLRNGAENGRMLAEAAILRDNEGNSIQKDVDGKPYPMFDVALSDFSTYCVDLQAQAKGVSIKTLEETKEYTRNVVNEGLFAYLEKNPQVSIREIMASPEMQKAIAIEGLQNFKLSTTNQNDQTKALKLKMELLWEHTPIANKPAAKEISSAVDLTNHLEVALHEIMATVNTHTIEAAVTPESIQDRVNKALLNELQEAHEKILVKTIDLIKQYPWLVTDPNLMKQVGESFAQASTTQLTQTTKREGETEAKMRLHMDVTQSNAFVYRDEKRYEKLKGEAIASGEKGKKDSTQVFLKRAQKIVIDPTATIKEKADKLLHLSLEGNMNPYRIQYIDTGGVESVSKDLFNNDLQIVMGFCTGNPKQLQAYFKDQITYKKSLSEPEKNRLLKTHNLPTLLNEKNLPKLLNVFVEELYSQPIQTFLANNPAQKGVLQEELRNLLQTKNPQEAFFTKLKEDRITLFKAELPNLFNTQIFDIQGNVQDFELAWDLVQSELSKRRIGYDFPHYAILKAKYLQISTGYSLLQKAGGDHNDLLLKSLGRIFHKAYGLDKEAFETLAKESLTHIFIAKPEQAGKMMALFLPENVVEAIANTVKQVARLKQALPWMIAAFGTAATASISIVKYNSFETDQKKHRQMEKEEKALLANIALAQKTNKKLSKTTPSLKQKGLLG